MTKNEIKQKIAETVDKARVEKPLAPSITNTVTVNLVANAQLAVGGSAAMIYMPDEAKAIAAIGGAMYINMGTILPIYAETLPETAKVLHDLNKPWVVDPVGFGMGAIRMDCLMKFKEYKPSIIRGNASEVIGLARLWGLVAADDSAGPRGVDSVDTVQSAREAAVAIARHTGGAVAVSGQVDLVTDGKQVAYAYGGSHFMEKITGAGCSLGGVCAVYAAVAEPFIAALSATLMYNLAGSVAERLAKGPASFQMDFIDNMYMATGSMVSTAKFEVEEA